MKEHVPLGRFVVEVMILIFSFFLTIVTIFCLACTTRIFPNIFFLLIFIEIVSTIIIIKKHVFTLLIRSSCSLDIVYIVQLSVLQTLADIIL